MTEREPSELSQNAKAVAGLAVAAVTDHMMSKPSWGDLDRRVRVVERRAKSLLLTMVLLTFVTLLIASYLSMNLHEIYRDACEPSVTGGSVEEWCDNVFIGDNDPGQHSGTRHGH